MVEYKKTNKFTENVINELLNIQKQKGLTPEEIVKTASKKDNPLHELFEWDDEIGGLKYRLHQARMIVNEIKVVIDSKEYFAFENVVVNVDGATKGQTREYVPIVEILNDEDMRQQVIQSALNQLSSWKKQYESYHELSPIMKVAEKVETKLKKLWLRKKKV